jgi:hypothetical protein
LVVLRPMPVVALCVPMLQTGPLIQFEVVFKLCMPRIAIRQHIAIVSPATRG